MTKKQWYNLQVKDKVTTDTHDVVKVDGKATLVPKTLTGEVIRLNSNKSQVLVKFDNNGSERWYGRLGIEVFTLP